MGLLDGGDEIRTNRLAELLNGAYTGNPNIARQGRRAGVGTRQDRFSGPAAALLSGLLGNAPDEQSGSVLDPNSARNSPIASNIGFGLGTALQISPVFNRLAALLSSSNTSRAMRVNGKIVDPDAVPQRGFNVDYPQTAKSDASGRLTHDIDGNALSSTANIAGRRVVGGLDQRISDAGIRNTAEELGATSRTARRGEIGSDLGRLVTGRGRDGEVQNEILLKKGLSERDAPFVFTHETGHLIDGKAYGGRIPSDGIVNHLRKLYSDANSALAVKPGQIGATPEAMGYVGQKADDELMAEAIRMYMRDPNYMKTNYPEVSKRIRLHVNQNQNLKDVIQFNSAGGAATGVGYDANQRGLLD